jgi:hypothetical protein
VNAWFIVFHYKCTAFLIYNMNDCPLQQNPLLALQEFDIGTLGIYISKMQS